MKFILRICLILLNSTLLFANVIEFNNGLKDSIVFNMVSIDDYLFVSTEKKGVYKSSINTPNWEIANNNLDSTYPWILSLAASSQNLYLSTSMGLYYSNDYGKSWYIISNNLISTKYRNTCSISTFMDEVLYCINSEIYLSKNAGIDWELIGVGSDFQPIKKSAIHSNNICISTYDNKLLFSDDYGFNWINLISNQGSLFDFCFYDNEIIIATSTGVYVSQNKGQYWYPFDEGLPSDVSKVTMLEARQNNLYLITNKGIYIRTKSDSLWLRLDVDINYSRINTILENNNKLFIGTSGYGVLQIDVSKYNSIKLSDLDISKYILYPNPVSNYARLKLNSNYAGFASISIVDILGNTIKVYKVEVIENVPLELDFSTIPTGIYTILINNGYKTEALKMIKE